MKKFNLRKRASATDDTVPDKRLDENRKNIDLSNEKQGVVGKNINLSMPVKDKDNTVPFNQQLNSARKNDTPEAITEASMDKKEVNFGDKTEGVMPINVKTQEFDKEKTEAFKKAEKEKRDTAFWDKYVGVQLDGKMKNVDNNIPPSTSQLQNSPDRFTGSGTETEGKEEGINLKVDKMVMASLQDADAMLFHIYATAAKDGRKLTAKEEQQIIDINSGKMRLIAQAPLPGTSSVIIRKELGLANVYDGESKIDEFKSCDEAKANYPEGEIVDV